MIHARLTFAFSGLVAVTELAGEVLLFLRAWALWQRHPAVLAAGGFLILSYAAILLYCTLDAFVPVPAFRQKAAWSVCHCQAHQELTLRHSIATGVSATSGNLPGYV
jgi:hypothetical protein